MHVANEINPSELTKDILVGDGTSMVDLLCLKNRHRYQLPHVSWHLLSV